MIKEECCQKKKKKSNLPRSISVPFQRSLSRFLSLKREKARGRATSSGASKPLAQLGPQPSGTLGIKSGLPAPQSLTVTLQLSLRTAAEVARRKGQMKRKDRLPLKSRIRAFRASVFPSAAGRAKQAEPQHPPRSLSTCQSPLIPRPCRPHQGN